MAFFKTTNKLIISIDDFFDLIDQGGLIFKEGISNYLNSNSDQFKENLKQITKYEGIADSIKRKIENSLYTKSLLPQVRGDILILLENFDDLIDTVKENLIAFDIEKPIIPENLNADILKLTQLTVSAVEYLIPAARAYFKNPDKIKDQLNRVYFYERETDKQSRLIMGKIYSDENNYDLAYKMQLKYFIENIEKASDTAEKIADQLAILAIKRVM